MTEEEENGREPTGIGLSYDEMVIIIAALEAMIEAAADMQGYSEAKEKIVALHHKLLTLVILHRMGAL
jgi:hypothetical protein